MKTILVTLAALSSGLGLGYSIQDSANPAAAQDPMQPGPQHALLQKHVGTWDAVVVTHDEQGKEVRDKGTMVNKKLSDFHTADQYSGEFMGMPFTGNGVNTYCPLRKQFITFWTDSMSPSPLILQGDYDAKTKTMTMTGEMFGMSGKLEPCRTVTVHKDADHIEWSMYGPGPDGKEVQHLRIEYTRRK